MKNADFLGVGVIQADSQQQKEIFQVAKEVVEFINKFNYPIHIKQGGLMKALNDVLLTLLERFPESRNTIISGMALNFAETVKMLTTFTPTEEDRIKEK